VNASQVRFSATAMELRRAFDASFAGTRDAPGAAVEDFLAVRLGSDSYALRLSEIAGIFVDKRITRLPSRVPSLVGMAGFRGAILPVYDLAVLVGYPSTSRWRWLAIAASDPVAFVFERFEGHLRLAREAVASTDARSDQLPVREMAHGPDRLLPIVHIPSVVDAIKLRLSHVVPRKER
jgi:chemotaxis signal transduction protein